MTEPEAERVGKRRRQRGDRKGRKVKERVRLM